MNTQAATDVTHDADTVLRRWRSRALTITLLVTVIIAIPAIISAAVYAVQSGKSYSLVIICTAYILMLIILIFRNIPHSIRIWAFLISGLALGIMNLLIAALNGSGTIYLVMMPVYAFILGGEKTGWTTMSLSLIVIICVAVFYIIGTIPLPLAIDIRSPMRWISSITTLAMLLAIAVVLLRQFYRLQLKTLKAEQDISAKLRQAYDSTLEGWAKALELRDHETEGHCRRVTELSLEIAKAMGLNDEELVNVYRGALLHDIGKMGIPDSVLLKPDKLTEAEWKVMKQHPVYGRDMLEPINYLNRSIDIPYHHHEKWNGGGYPTGLKGEQIPLIARIFTVVDVWDALTSDRPYRKAWSGQEALSYLEQRADIDFDPEVVKSFKMVLLNDSGKA